MNGLIETFFGYFGYQKAEERKNEPSPTNIDYGEDFTSSQPNLDYWTKKVRETVYVDDSDKTRYNELRNMDNEVAEITSALDVNADYIVYPNEKDKTQMLKVTCDIPKVQEKIEEIERRVNIQECLFAHIRAMLKYGDNAEELVVSVDGKRFLGFRNIPIKTMTPVMIQGYPSSNPRILQVINGKVHAEFNDNEVFHLCLNTDRERYCQYGKGVSMIERSRLHYRQLRLMEEGMMVTRLSRANQNYAMVVDVGELQGEEALSFLDSYKKRIMRRKYINPKTGKFAWEYNPLSVVEDIMVPTRAGSGGNVIPLNNNANSGKDIDDIYYCQDKLIYSTGTPKLLIGKELDVNSKSTSDNQVGVFLRRIRRIQTSITPEIKKLYKNILAIEGFSVGLDNLEVFWPSSITVDEQRNLVMDKTRAEIAKILKIDLELVDDEYIYKNILGMTDQEIDELVLRLDLQKEDSEEDSEENELPTKEELIKIVKNKLTDEEYQKWEEMQSILNNNPSLKECVIDLVNLLQACQN